MCLLSQSPWYEAQSVTWRCKSSAGLCRTFGASFPPHWCTKLRFIATLHIVGCVVTRQQRNNTLQSPRQQGLSLSLSQQLRGKYWEEDQEQIKENKWTSCWQHKSIWSMKWTVTCVICNRSVVMFASSHSVKTHLQTSRRSFSAVNGALGTLL